MARRRMIRVSAPIITKAVIRLERQALNRVIRQNCTARQALKRLKLRRAGGRCARYGAARPRRGIVWDSPWIAVCNRLLNARSPAGAPGFDPNLFVDGIDQIHWDELNTSPDRPLLNRALRGTYPPGSTYKPFMALAALTLGKRTPQWGFYDSGRYTLAGHVFRDDKPGG